jgi:hypothetical protein
VTIGIKLAQHYNMLSAFQDLIRMTIPLKAAVGKVSNIACILQAWEVSSS